MAAPTTTPSSPLNSDFAMAVDPPPQVVDIDDAMPDADLDDIGIFDGPQPDFEDINLLAIDDLVFAASLVLGAPDEEDLQHEPDPFGWGAAIG